MFDRYLQAESLYFPGSVLTSTEPVSGNQVQVGSLVRRHSIIDGAERDVVGPDALHLTVRVIGTGIRTPRDRILPGNSASQHCDVRPEAPPVVTARADHKERPRPTSRRQLKNYDVSRELSTSLVDDGSEFNAMQS